MLKKLLDGTKLVGDIKSFSLEERIFNTFCIIAFIAMAFEVPFNYFIGLPVPAALCVFGVFISIGLYYLSRFKRKSKIAIQIFCIVCHITFTVNYFFNSGIFGPNLLLFSLAFLLIIAIISTKEFKIWVPINILLVFGILIVEYFNPHIAPNVYVNVESKFIDFGITYFVTVILTYFAISYIRKNYDYERFSVLKRNSSIEAQNVRILAQKDDLERLDAERNKLMSLVSHDLRTPLNSIQGYLEILTEEDLGAAERIGLEKHLLQITRDTSEMLNNVLTWSKSQLEGPKVSLIRLNVGEILKNGLSIEKNISQRKGVGLSIDAEDDLCVLADINMMQLILRNLVNNAIKFTPANGSVKVYANNIAGSCVISIVDDGIGISEIEQEKLFAMKASSTYGTNNEKGVGLGLVLCKEFTELQNGKIWYEANPIQGSGFYISFKLCTN
ncbi:MAG: HAMP domain-containing histidine kinase [Flavobacterium sp.]|nr:MAG: HAMP domain-containing histidine kinase [Flavobacterium sp.]